MSRAEALAASEQTKSHHLLQPQYRRYPQYGRGP